MTLSRLMQIHFLLSRHMNDKEKPIVTIELRRDQAQEFLFGISREINNMALVPGGVSLALGEVFEYAGIQYRVIERAP